MARTRPRPRTDRAGRHPNGPRTVALPRKDLVTNLRAASDKLRASNSPQLADTVDELLQPGGWAKLRRAIEPVTLVTKPLKLSVEDRDHYLAASTAAGSSLTEDAVEGLRAFVAGTFSTEGHPRRTTGGGPFVTTSFRVPEDLLQQIDAGVRIGYVVKAWLARKYPKSAE